MTVICNDCSDKRANRDCIINDDNSTCFSCLKYYNTEKRKRNSTKLKECDVYTVSISDVSHYYSFVEWGKAKSMGKVLIVHSENSLNENEAKEYKYLIKDSIKSLKKQSKEMRKYIIKNHPFLNLSSYKKYKKYLNVE